MVGRRDYYYRVVSELTGLLSSLVGSYRYLVAAADELNRITLAHKDDVEDAIDRADDLGDIVSCLIKELERQVNNYLREIKEQYPGELNECVHHGGTDTRQGISRETDQMDE
ncbi:MAG: hypothetical protein HPY81_04805 [Firmicutes bacterium]|nr:hypothetical protein [Bacillota bacterium]